MIIFISVSAELEDSSHQFDLLGGERKILYAQNYNNKFEQNFSLNTHAVGSDSYVFLSPSNFSEGNGPTVE